MKGVATNWLSHMKPDKGGQYKVPIYVRRSQFRLPFKTNMPVIMIGPGTGLAPYRGFLQERHFQKNDGKLTLVMLNKLMPHPLLISIQSDYLFQVFDRNSHI